MKGQHKSNNKSCKKRFLLLYVCISKQRFQQMPRSMGRSVMDEYECSQLCGSKGKSQKIINQDMISALKFNDSGEMLAIGDRAGRIIIFQSNTRPSKSEQEEELQHRSLPSSHSINPPYHSKSAPPHTPTYQYYHEFVSHQKQFDPLKSIHLQEEIKYVSWLKNQGKYHKLITSNFNTIKILKLYQDHKHDRRTHKRIRFDWDHHAQGWDEHQKQNIYSNLHQEIKIKSSHYIQDHDDSLGETSINVQFSKIFPAKHRSTMNSISVSNNEQYLLTSDEKDVFLWDLQESTKPFILHQRNSNSPLQKSQGITCSKFHPFNENIFIYGTSKGHLNMVDHRSSFINSNIIKFEGLPQKNMTENFITSMISKLTSVTFNDSNTKYLVTRDLISIKIWDVCQSKVPLKNILIDQHIDKNLFNLFENEKLQDKFDLSIDSRGNILTGNYNNSFHLIDSEGEENMQYELSYDEETSVRKVPTQKEHGNNHLKHVRKYTSIETGLRVLKHDVNKVNNQIAVVTENCFFVYSPRNQRRLTIQQSLDQEMSQR